MSKLAVGGNMPVAKHTNSGVSQTKSCRVCSEDIKLAARKCIHCDSWQERSWSVDLSVVSTVLSLSVAFIAVLTSSYPVLKDILTPIHAVFSSTLVDVNRGDISVLVHNSGGMDGEFRRVLFKVTGPDQKGYWNFEFLPLQYTGPILFQPNETKLIDLSMNNVEAECCAINTDPKGVRARRDNVIQSVLHDLANPNLAARSKCVMRYQVSDFNGRPSEILEVVDCSRWTQFLKLILADDAS